MREELLRARRPIRWRRPRRPRCGRAASTSSSASRASRSTSRSSSAAARGAARPPTTCSSPGRPGLGKTTLSGIVAAEMDVGLRITSGPALERAGDLAAILTNLDDGDVLFIDEIHRLPRPVEEVLYPAMEDFQLDIVIGKGPSARSIRLDLPRFTLDRRHHAHRAHHRPAARPLRLHRPPRLLRRRRLVAIVERAARHPRRAARARPARCGDRPALAGHAPHRQPAAEAGARLRRGAGRRRGHRRESPATRSTLFEVDELGLDKVDRAILAALCATFAGQPVGPAHAGGGGGGGAGDGRGGLRAVPAQGGPAAAHAPGPGGHAAARTPTWTSRRPPRRWSPSLFSLSSRR